MMIAALFSIAVSALWAMGWSLYFGSHGAEPTPQRLWITVGPLGISMSVSIVTLVTKIVLLVP